MKKTLPFLYCALASFLLMDACSPQDSSRPVVLDPGKRKEFKAPVSIRKNDSLRESDLFTDLLKAKGLVNIRDLDSGILVDLKYAGTDNFLKMNLYGNFKTCFLQPDVAQRLVMAQKLLRKKYPFYSLIVYDAVRPLHIQKLMWDTLKMPAGNKQQYLSSPEIRSLHNYGTAVDLSIITRDGNVLDMGTSYDYFGALAHPEFEERFLKEGKLSLRQVMNRELLREVMQEAGFHKIETEWWHFNSCSRAEAERRYSVIP